MTQMESTTSGSIFDLTVIDPELRAQDTYTRDGHTARTLVRESDGRVVLIVDEGGRPHRGNKPEASRRR